ncbi:MAG: hypothetical protein EPO08_15980 [Rhodospirillaceae bacterium]|nr:MAG: hypothetical protein EPO08_15980 [Rhodospirillaceae bacterium]
MAFFILLCGGYWAIAVANEKSPSMVESLSNPADENARIAASKGYVVRQGAALTVWLDADKSRGVAFRNWNVKRGDRDNASYEYLTATSQNYFIELHYDHDAPSLFVVQRTSGEVQSYYTEDDALYLTPSQQRLVVVRRSSLSPQKPLLSISGVNGTAKMELSCNGAGEAKMTVLTDDSVTIDWKEKPANGRAITFTRNENNWAVAEGDAAKSLVCR